MSKVLEVVKADTILAVAVHSSLEKEMGLLRDQGLRDCKTKIFASRETTTQSLGLALANLLRLNRTGKVHPIKVG